MPNNPLKPALLFPTLGPNDLIILETHNGICHLGIPTEFFEDRATAISVHGQPFDRSRYAAWYLLFQSGTDTAAIRRDHAATVWPTIDTAREQLAKYRRETPAPTMTFNSMLPPEIAAAPIDQDTKLAVIWTLGELHTAGLTSELLDFRLMDKYQALKTAGYRPDPVAIAASLSAIGRLLETLSDDPPEQAAQGTCAPIDADSSPYLRHVPRQH